MKLSDTVFYHIYPLGALGVLDGERRYEPGNFRNSPVDRGLEEAPLRRILDWVRPMKQIGANGLYLGPVFESEWHGYETVDHRKVDSRLGSNADLKALSLALREQEISLVLDAVFTHVGRTHPLVQDLAARGSSAPFRDWISGYDPNRINGGGLPFFYDTWAGHCNLVKLDTGNPKVQDYLLETVMYWIEEFDVAGLRLDAADCLDRGFLRRLSAACRERREDFFLIGEAVHGDYYQTLLRDGGLSSVTNYEAYKGLWSSYNDRNYFEISWTLDRLFGERGICKGSILYSFADNHDVDRYRHSSETPRGCTRSTASSSPCLGSPRSITEANTESAGRNREATTLASAPGWIRERSLSARLIRISRWQSPDSRTPGRCRTRYAWEATASFTLKPRGSPSSESLGNVPLSWA